MVLSSTLQEAVPARAALRLRHRSPHTHFYPPSCFVCRRCLCDTPQLNIMGIVLFLRYACLPLPCVMVVVVILMPSAVWPPAHAALRPLPPLPPLPLLLSDLAGPLARPAFGPASAS